MNGSGASFNRISCWLWLHLGYWLERKGMAVLAETCYRNGAGGNGEHALEAAFRLSQQLLGQGRNREAASTCEQALRAGSGHARLWCALGAAQRRLAQMDAARESYEKSIALAPRYAEAWCNLGEWWLVKGDLPAALDRFERALVFDPGLIEALNNRVAVLYELGRFGDAESAARQAIEAHPDQAALHVNLGNVLFHTGKARLAIKAFRKAIECDPACSEAHIGLASLLGESHRLAEALTFIEHEIAIKGESAQRLVSLAQAQQAKGNWQAAEAVCRQVLKMQPNNVSALITLTGCLSVRADHLGAIHYLERALAENANMPAIQSNVAFLATYLPDKSADEVFATHREWAVRFDKNVANRYAFARDPAPQPDRPLRIGYVSGDFGTHPVGFLLRDVARYHDRRNFYIHCYSMMRGSDAITEVIRENSDSWIDALLLSDDELAEQVHQDRIDILVDLAGHTAYNRLSTFAMKPAPVQATWIGYFHSTGLDSIDYFITDPHTSPRGCGQLFSETPVWLPHSRFCYSPPDYAPEVSPPPMLTGRPITFGSFNRVEKLVDPVLAAWVAILEAIPGSRLLLKAGTLESNFIRDDLRRRFAALGLDDRRLDLRGPSSHPEMLAQYAEVDVALDPFPFNGGMTTLEALWMGVPVVTIAGQGVVSRQTQSALANIGLADQLAFADPEAYIQGAVALAGNQERLVALRQALRPRMAASPLRQPEQFTRDLEALYRRMWHAWCEGKRLPSDLDGAPPDST
jgi:predicted O-linked N-acetylglucosamine transferase (SPINDLY family)